MRKVKSKFYRRERKEHKEGRRHAEQTERSGRINERGLNAN